MASLPKKNLRRQMAAVREAVTGREAKEASMRRHLSDSAFYRQAEKIFLYASMGTEADTMQIYAMALADGKQAAFPRVEGRNIRFYYVEKAADLIPGFWGIAEPGTSCMPALPDEKTLMLVPGLAFDRDGFRLGYGGGFYDRYLAEFTGFTAVGLCYSDQITSVPRESFDIPLAAILTDKELFVIS